MSTKREQNKITQLIENSTDKEFARMIDDVIGFGTVLDDMRCVVAGWSKEQVEEFIKKYNN